MLSGKGGNYIDRGGRLDLNYLTNVHVTDGRFIKIIGFLRRIVYESQTLFSCRQHLFKMGLPSSNEGVDSYFQLSLGRMR